MFQKERVIKTGKKETNQKKPKINEENEKNLKTLKNKQKNT